MDHPELRVHRFSSVNEQCVFEIPMGKKPIVRRSDDTHRHLRPAAKVAGLSENDFRFVALARRTYALRQVMQKIVQLRRAGAHRRMGTRWNSRSMSNKPTIRSARCHIPMYLGICAQRSQKPRAHDSDLVPSGESIAGPHVPNHRFCAIRRRPCDGVVRTGELNVGTVGKGDDYSVVRADHSEPLAGAR
jgi:hypothetical protein